MRYHYRVITPFTRFENLVPLSRMLKCEGIFWHPILNDDLPFGIHNILWIEPWYCPKPEEGFNPVHSAINFFLSRATIHPEDRYLFLMDDDWWEPGFLEKLDKHEGELLICSMLRGQHQPPKGLPYGTDPLTAAPENLKVGHVGAEQLIVSGRLLKDCKFGPEPFADGLLIEKLAKEHKVEFVPEANVWFNYLEPGRWEKA